MWVFCKKLGMLWMDLTNRLKAWMNIVTGRNSLVYVMAVLTAEMEDCLLTTWWLMMVFIPEWICCMPSCLFKFQQVTALCLINKRSCVAIWHTGRTWGCKCRQCTGIFTHSCLAPQDLKLLVILLFMCSIIISSQCLHFFRVSQAMDYCIWRCLFMRSVLSSGLGVNRNGELLFKFTFSNLTLRS
jgi:hypothetical protein